MKKKDKPWGTCLKKVKRNYQDGYAKEALDALKDYAEML